MRPQDLTLRGVVDQSIQAIASIDGTLLRTFRCLITRPGALTIAYLHGQRKSFTLPLQLFLVANVLFFALQSLTGVKVFSTPLDMHLHDQAWSGIAEDLVKQQLEKTGTNLTAYTPVFNQAVALNAKSLVVLMVLPFALLTPIVFWRNRQPLVAHLVFSVHLYTFLLLLFSLALLVASVDLLLGGAGLASVSFDHGLSIVAMVACGVYLYLAMGPVYRATGLLRIFQSVVLVTAVAAIVLAYRFALLLITLYST